MILDYFLSLGSNIDAEQNLPSAVRMLGERGRLIAASGVYETAPVGPAGQANFLNAVVLVGSPLEPELFQEEVIRRVEHALGRRRSSDKYAPRTIDIDMLLAGDRILMVGHRKIPSDEILTRAFVVLPLAEIAPDRLHPELGIPFQQIAAGFKLEDGEIFLRKDVTLGGI